jgi:hypothetical protein
VTDKEVDNVLKWAADAPHEVDGNVVQRVSDRILPSLRPIRPLPSIGVISLILVFIFIIVATLGATYLGFNGSRVLNGSERVLIFWLIALLASRTATAGAAAMVPGGRSHGDPYVLLAIGAAAFPVAFAILFHDFRMDRFVSEGIICLAIGSADSAIAGFLIWLVIRRGVILNPLKAGVAAGTLAGLAGLAMLELHCPILKAMHLMVWHTAVIPVSALAGYGIGRLAQDLGTKRKDAEFIQ